MNSNMHTFSEADMNPAPGFASPMNLLNYNVKSDKIIASYT